MQGHDIQPSRFDEAKKEIGSMIDQLGPQDRMTLIAVESTPRIVASATGDRDALHRGLDSANASNGPADLSSALSLAAGLVLPAKTARAYSSTNGIIHPLLSTFPNPSPC